jgi:hypothetical protein
MVDGPLQAANGVMAETLGAAGERAEPVVLILVRHLPTAVTRTMRITRVRRRRLRRRGRGIHVGGQVPELMDARPGHRRRWRC